MSSGASTAGLLAYIVAAHLSVRRLGGIWRSGVFALLNLASFYWFFFYGRNMRETAAFGVYLGVVFLQYMLMRIFSDRRGWSPWVAFFAPICFLIAVRYVPPSSYAMLSPRFEAFLRLEPNFTLATYFIGISYLAFRSSYLVLEVRNGLVSKPSLWEYFGFCFFLPTIPAGPINPYSNFQRAFAPVPPAIFAGRSALRIVVGLVKYQFLGKLCDQLSYSGLLMDDHYHPWSDLPIAAVFYYLYLYCNFSGFCDMAIGTAGLIGIPVAENFNNPLAARNLKEFWNRWHITLSLYMREVVFSPLSKFLAHALGPANVNHAIALTMAVVFLLVGVWHGAGWNFVVLGAFHAVGCVVNHYYTIVLKKGLGREGFKKYNANRWIQAAAVAVTFCYVTASLFFFANSFSEMRDIMAAMR